MPPAPALPSPIGRAGSAGARSPLAALATYGTGPGCAHAGLDCLTVAPWAACQPSWLAGALKLSALCFSESVPCSFRPCAAPPQLSTGWLTREPSGSPHLQPSIFLPHWLLFLIEAGCFSSVSLSSVNLSVSQQTSVESQAPFWVMEITTKDKGAEFQLSGR